MKSRSILSLLMLLSVLNAGSSAQPGWSRQSPVPPVQSPSDVCFTDASVGTVVGSTFDEREGYGATILRTTDGGKNWSSRNSGITGGLSDVTFVEARKLVVVH